MSENRDDSEILRYAYEFNQRLPFLILGLVLAAAQAVNEQYAFAVIFVAVFALIFFTYGQTQTRLDPEGIIWRGSFGRQVARWESVQSIEPGKALGIQQVRIAVDGKPRRTLPAPVNAWFIRDRRFAAKAEEIRAYAAAHGAMLGVDPDARENADSDAGAD